MPLYFAILLWHYMASALIFGRPGPSTIRDTEDEA